MNQLVQHIQDMLILMIVNSSMFVLTVKHQGVMDVNWARLLMIPIRNVNGREKFLNGIILIFEVIYNYLIIYFQFSADWYKDRLTDAQLDELENPKPAPTRSPSSPSRRKSNKKPKRVQAPVEDEE